MPDVFDWDDRNIAHLARQRIKRTEVEFFRNDPAIADTR